MKHNEPFLQVNYARKIKIVTAHDKKLQKSEIILVLERIAYKMGTLFSLVLLWKFRYPGGYRFRNFPLSVKNHMQNLGLLQPVQCEFSRI